MKYDFCFLYHPHLYETNPGAQVGLGLLSLATYAKELGASVKVINAQELTIKETLSLIPKCKYLMLYGCLVDAGILNQIIATRRFAVDYIYIGGPIAKSRDKIERANGVVDGPGEDFVEELHIRGPMKGHTPMISNLSKNINEYPFPDRSLLQGKYGGNIFRKIECDVSTTILTSRGCNFRCAFCMSGGNNFFQNYNMSRIEKELEHCLSLGIKHYRISDDNLMGISTNRLYNLCKLFKEAKITWRASIRTYPSYSWVYREMVESGCRELSFGVESGDQNVLNVLRKTTNVHQNTKAFESANMAGVEGTRALIMMGTPGETIETLQKNINWIEEARPSVVSLKMFVPYPGTAIYDAPTDFDCVLYPLTDPNNSAYRPDNTEPQANIISRYLSRTQLTNQFYRMKTYLEKRGIENRG